MSNVQIVAIAIGCGTVVFLLVAKLIQVCKKWLNTKVYKVLTEPGVGESKAVDMSDCIIIDSRDIEDTEGYEYCECTNNSWSGDSSEECDCPEESFFGNNPYDGDDVADYEPSSSSSHSFGEGESCFEGTYSSSDASSSDYGSDE